MKTLFLVRHAKSSWEDPKLDDFERPLNKRGLRDAPFMGRLLAESGEHPDLILTSPAKRAKATARFFAEALGLPADKVIERKKIYEAGTDSLLDLILELEDSVKSAMIVGHNPGITQLAGRLSVLPVDSMPTCSIVAVTFDTDEWKQLTGKRGGLKFFETPKKHLRK